MTSLETDTINKGKKLIKGTLVLRPKNFNVVSDTVPPSLDNSSVALKLISATKAEDGSDKGKVGKQTFLEAKNSPFNIEFEWNSHSMGSPGAFYIENLMQDEFFLVSLSLEDDLHHGTINFVCNSWIYNTEKYKTDRIFFANYWRSGHQFTQEQTLGGFDTTRSDFDHYYSWLRQPHY